MVRSAWILNETWHLEDWRETLHMSWRASTREVRKAQRDFQRALKAERQRRVKTAGTSIEGLLEADSVKEAWDHLVR